MRTDIVIAGVIIGGIGFFLPAPSPPFVIGFGLLLLLIGIIKKSKLRTV